MLHGTFYAVLLFVLLMMFLEVTFGILDPERINALIALVLILGVASTLVKSHKDDVEADPNYVPSNIWRFIIFIFFIVGEIFLMFWYVI